jgi:hypothetical protein
VVDVWTLFTIHLDVDVMFVHQRGAGIVLKYLVFHHMTPMASRIADGNEDELIFILCLFQKFFIPW